MLEHLARYKIVRMAKVRSGFYYWIENRHKVTQRDERPKLLDRKVLEVIEEKKNAIAQGESKKSLKTMVINNM